MKYIYSALGAIALMLGVIGIVVPLLPTTPFLLLAAMLFFKSSPQLYAWLINHKYLGEYIRNFRENRAIPMRVKIISISLVWATIGYCILNVVNEWWWAQLSLLILAIALTWHLLSFKTLRR